MKVHKALKSRMHVSRLVLGRVLSTTVRFKAYFRACSKYDGAFQV